VNRFIVSSFGFTRGYADYAPSNRTQQPHNTLPDLAAAGFEALGSVLLLGLRARASRLDELLRAELALRRRLLDLHAA
jgi:hypothetical protein